MYKLLSIIIPTYNMEKYLHKCLDSLIVSDENMLLLEVLVVNDGSKDSSSSIGHEYEAKYPQTFRVIDKENGNYGSCINRGLKEAKGKYIKVIDADDYSDPYNLNLFIIFLSETDTDAIVSDFDVVSSNGTITQKKVFSQLFYSEKTVIPFSEFARNKGDITLPMHSLTYNLKMVHDMDYKQTEGISYTDQEWATIPMTMVKSICYYHQSVYKYLIGREGQTMVNYYDVANPRQLFVVIKNIAHYYQEQSYEHIYDRFIKQRLIKLLKSIYYSGLRDHTIKIEELISYDKEIRSYPRVYALTDELKLYHNHIDFVKYWHSGNKLKFFVYVVIPVKLRNMLKK